MDRDLLPAHPSGHSNCLRALHQRQLGHAPGQHQHQDRTPIHSRQAHGSSTPAKTHKVPPQPARNPGQEARRSSGNPSTRLEDCEPGGYDVSTGSPSFEYFAISDLLLLLILFAFQITIPLWQLYGKVKFDISFEVYIWF
jgi:hypothetical protein